MGTRLRIAAIATLLSTPAAALAAQSISLKTVPIPAGEQFQILPSRNLGMGGVHVALDDALLDPFANPARGALLEQLRILALPTLYGEATNMVGGRSFPIAATVPGERFFGTVAFAMQQVDNPNRFTWIGPVLEDQSVIQDDASSNVYVHATLGVRLGARTSVGAGVFHADLDAVDAVNLLYGRSIAVNQAGSVSEARVGLLHDLGGQRTLDAVVLRSSVDMKHEVLYQDWTGGPIWEPMDWRTWTELNEDRTITWGAHARYTQPLGNDGTRIGFIATGNTKSHPKIPNYNIVNIPRDPGNSTVFNVGVGLSRTVEKTSLALELVFEPGRSHTWAYADTTIAVPTGTLQAGDKTIDNQFRFGNWHMAFGIDREGERAGFQLGLRLKHTRYSLDQHNYLTDVQRDTEERWMEWTPTWGGVLKFPEFELRYTGRFTAKGWPDTAMPFFGGRDVIAMPEGPDFVIGPTEPVWLPEYRVTMHRLLVSIPFGL